MRSVTWNGMTQFRPGGLTRINANALAQIGLATNGIVGLVGEAEGGTPGEIITIDDPSLAKTTFRSGPLANAIQIAFDPSVDPRMPGGAFRCLCVKTNNGTRATLTLYNRAKIGTVDAGSTATIINFTGGGLTASAYVGGRLIIGAETRPITANTATTITVTPGFSGAPAATTPLEIHVPMIVITSRDYGAHTNQNKFEFEPGVTLGSAWTNSFEGKSQTSPDLGGTSFLKVEYTGAYSQTAIVVASGVTTGGAGSQITDALASFGTLDNYFLLVTGGGLVNPNFRKISTNTATQINVTNAFTGIPAAGATYSVRRGMIYTATATGGAAATITMPATIDLALNELVGMQIYISSGTGAGQRRVITANTAGASSIVTVTPAWTTMPVAASSVFEIRYATTCSGSFIGASGVATGFRTSLAVDGAVAATDFNYTFAPGDTLEHLAELINADGDYLATVPSGVNGQTTLCSTFDFDLGSTAIELRYDKNAVLTQPNPTYSYAVPWPNNFKRDLQVVVDDINNTAEQITAARATTCVDGGSGRPAYTGGTVGTAEDVFQYLSGGTRGTSDNTAFQTALDLLLGVRCNFVVPLISRDLTAEGYSSTATFTSVAAQLSAHVDLANGIGKSERGGLLGMNGTFTQLLSEITVLNNADIQLCGQKIQVLDVSSTLTLMDEWALAVTAAAMRAGAPEVGEPLTHKYIKTYDLQQDASWDPMDRTDANKAIGGGLLFCEFIDGKGTRFVRDLTTHVQDDNLAYMEGSTRDVVRYVAYGLRTYLEDKFTGIKAQPTNVSGIKQAATAWLEQANADNIIVTSYNEKGVLVPGFENLRVTISGDVATLKVQVYPAVGINFQLNDIYLQLPRLAA